MSQVRRNSLAFATGCALLAALAVGCSKKNGPAFDPDAGHPEDFFSTHPAAYRNSGGGCAECHGGNLLGGISKVSCFSTSRDGQTCHPGGPGGGHPAGWRSSHTATDPVQAATCAACHDNPPNDLPPDCFNNSLCHGPKEGHPAGWRTAHQGTSQGDAPGCAECHPDKGTPSCFNNTSCHAAGGNPHPSGWKDQHDNTDPGQASSCAPCHQSNPGTPGCFNNTLCHGGEGDEDGGDEDGGDD